MTLNLSLRRAFKWTFVIADVQTAILGADFLRHYGLLPDLRRRRLVDPLTTLSTLGVCHRPTTCTVQLILPMRIPDGEHHEQYARLLHEFEDLTRPSQVSAVLEGSAVEHEIHTSGPPIFERPRRLAGERLEAARKEFSALLDRGIVRPSSSQWSSPLHMVRKSSGGWRVTGDYRRLNSVTVPDRYPLPLIDDLLQDCRSCTVFSSIDLQKAFHQIPVAPDDIKKTAVTTPFGLYEFVGTPLGLRNSAQTFQRFINSLLRRLPFVKPYLDDLLVASTSHAEHLVHLRQLFETLREARLAINADKSIFGAREVKHLGYLISADGFRPPPHQVDAVANFPRPRSPKQLRRFLGMLNFYRRCVKNAAELQAPLNDLLKGKPKNSKKPLDWSAAADEAFQRSKDSLQSAIRATFLDRDAPLTLSTDASDTALGAALDQFQDGCWKPLGFFSRKLKPAESRYSTYDRELLAVYAACKHFQRLLEGRSFNIRTDHRPLVFAALQRADKASPRAQRQLDYILQLNATIQPVKGQDNIVADALSRIETINVPTVIDAEAIQMAQEADEELPHLKDVPALNLQQLSVEDRNIFCDISTGAVRPYLPATLRRTAFDVLHNSSHPSGRATASLVQQKFFWPALRKDVLRWSRECEPCQRSKVHRHNRTALGRFNEPDNRFDHIHVDLIKLPPAGNFHYCLTVVDRFSRWPLAVPLPDMRAETVAKALVDSWISQYGTPLRITSDQGPQFESALFASLAQFFGAKRIHTSPYHPQSNGLVERLHRTLKAALMCGAPVPWPDLLPSVLLGLRTAIKSDLQASPAEMLYGTSLRIPGEFFVHDSMPADATTFAGKLRSLFQALKPVPAARHTQRHPFVFGDLKTCSHVFKRVDTVRKPLEPPYTGPHRVIKRLDDKNFIVVLDGAEKAVSADTLKPAYVEVSDNSQPSPQPTTPEASPPQLPFAATPPVSRPTTPPASSPSSQPLTSRTAERKRVSFRLPSGKVTGGRMDVATQIKPRPHWQLVTSQRSERRKQELRPRDSCLVSARSR